MWLKYLRINISHLCLQKHLVSLEHSLVKLGLQDRSFTHFPHRALNYQYHRMFVCHFSPELTVLASRPFSAFLHCYFLTHFPHKYFHDSNQLISQSFVFFFFFGQQDRLHPSLLLQGTFFISGRTSTALFFTLQLFQHPLKSADTRTPPSAPTMWYANTKLHPPTVLGHAMDATKRYSQAAWEAQGVFS